jgi:hypothetical protein
LTAGVQLAQMVFFLGALPGKTRFALMGGNTAMVIQYDDEFIKRLNIFPY